MAEDLDTSICPLCGRPNACGMAARKSADEAVDCWCKNVEIYQSVLDRIPKIAQQRACICRDCATQREEGPG